MLKLSNVFHKNSKSYLDKKRYIINQGGTSSTKTFSILQLLVWIAMNHELQIDIAGLSVPHLKKGVINDLPIICKQFGISFEENYKQSERILKLDKGTINFIAVDKLGKAHGGRRDILFLNEANHLKYPIAEQLMVRTRRAIFIDYNPTNVFWVQKKIMKEQPHKAVLIKSTYLDNKWLEQEIIDMIESKRGDGNNNFWRVYGLGELGVAEGLIFNNFEQSDFDINRFSNYRNGIDWGFSNDPFAFVRLAIENNKLYICKEIYKKGLLNKDSALMVKEIIDKEPVICDSAEPKSVAEYRSVDYRVNAFSAKKGKGSVESGIKKLQAFDKIIIHPDCPNAYDEFCNYHWVENKDGEDTRKPIDEWNHIIDAIRYATERDLNYFMTKLIGMRPF